MNTSEKKNPFVVLVAIFAIFALVGAAVLPFMGSLLQQKNTEQRAQKDFDKQVEEFLKTKEATQSNADSTEKPTTDTLSDEADKPETVTIDSSKESTIKEAKPPKAPENLEVMNLPTESVSTKNTKEGKKQK